MDYLVRIEDIAELREGITNVRFGSKTPLDADARSSNITASLIIEGEFEMDYDLPFPRDYLREISAWSILNPSSADTYKSVLVTASSVGEQRRIEFSHAFVVSFEKWYVGDVEKFTLILRQKKDRLDGVTFE